MSWELATRLPHHQEVEALRFIADGLWRTLPDLSLSSSPVSSVRQGMDWRHVLGKNPFGVASVWRSDAKARCLSDQSLTRYRISRAELFCAQCGYPNGRDDSRFVGVLPKQLASANAN